MGLAPPLLPLLVLPPEIGGQTRSADKPHNNHLSSLQLACPDQPLYVFYMVAAQLGSLTCADPIVSHDVSPRFRFYVEMPCRARFICKGAGDSFRLQGLSRAIPTPRWGAHRVGAIVTQDSVEFSILQATSAVHRIAISRYHNYFKLERLSEFRESRSYVIELDRTVDVCYTFLDERHSFPIALRETTRAPLGARTRRSR